MKSKRKVRVINTEPQTIVGAPEVQVHASSHPIDEDIAIVMKGGGNFTFKGFCDWPPKFVGNEEIEVVPDN
jgi:hypothetical protein